MRTAARDALVAAGHRPVVVVSLYTPGATYRAASSPLQVPAAGLDEPLAFDGRLVGTIKLEQEADLLGLDIAEIATTAKIEMVLPEDVDPATAEAEGAMLSASTCEVALAWPGEEWALRDVILPRGTVSGMDLGQAGEPISFTAEALPPRSGAAILDGTRDMGDDYPSSSSWTDLEGTAWPVIVGRVYKVPAYKLGDVEAGIGTTYAIAIAGHHLADTTIGDLGITIYEDGVEYTPVGTLSVANTADSDGGKVCWVQSTSTSDFAAASGAYTVDLAGGGIHGARAPGAALQAHGIVAWLLAQSGEDIDWPGCEEALERLRNWGMGLYADQPADTLATLRERVLRWVPVAERVTRDGLALRYVDALHDEPVVDLVYGVHLVDRLGGLVQLSDPDDIVNEVTLEYAYDHYTRRYARRVVVGADDNARARISRQYHGTRSEAQSCNTTWQEATARQMAHAIIDRRALTRFGQSYLLDPSMYWLEVGTICRVTDAGRGLSSRRCYARRLNPILDPARVTLEIVPTTGIGY